MSGQSTDESQFREKKVDVLRDTPVRLLGYANEVGEAFRAHVHVNVVRASYGVATAYMLADVVSKGNDARLEEKQQTSTESGNGSGKITKQGKTRIAEVMLDTMLWQGLASVIIPGFTINRLCWASALGLLRFAPAVPLRTRKWCVTAIGLAAIPFIVKPIDHFVDWTLDSTLRHYFKAESTGKSDTNTRDE